MFIQSINSTVDFTRGGTKSFLSSHKQVSSQIPSPQRVKVNEIIKGAVCRILTLLKHKNTIICLQIFKKHAKLTYLFI